VQLDSKISKLCGPDPPTSQDRRPDGRTDRRTDDMQSQYRAICTIVHRAVKSQQTHWEILLPVHICSTSWYPWHTRQV